MERNTSFVITLDARDFGSAQTSTTLDLDSARSHAHRALHRALHRASERDTLRQLIRDVVGDELRVQLGTLDLLDVDADFLAGELVQLVAQLIDFSALFADNDPGTAGVNGDDDLARLALDSNVGDRRVSETRLQIFAKELVLTQQRGEITVRVPLRSPGLGDAEPEPDRMCFLTHYFLLPFLERDFVCAPSALAVDPSPLVAAALAVLR